VPRHRDSNTAQGSGEMNYGFWTAGSCGPWLSRCAVHSHCLRKQRKAFKVGISQRMCTIFTHNKRSNMYLIIYKKQ